MLVPGAKALWPDTLPRFWGLHALGWSAAGVGLAGLVRFTPVPCSVPPALLCAGAAALAGANLALSTLLYRTDEEAGASLAGAAALYYGCAAALLHAASLPAAAAALGLGLGGAAARALRGLRLWHMAMALGSCVFVAKALSKDRLFAADGVTSKGAASRGAALPLLVVVNQGAGAKLGAAVAEALRARAAEAAEAGGTMRVVDVKDATPLEALRKFGAEHTAYRVLVCGGDGTVTWVLASIEELRAEQGDSSYRPTVGVLPLGTGNDLARVLGWGKSFRRELMISQLAKIDRARVAALDRWRMAGTLPEGRAEMRLCNYCSIGVDAKAALLWARLRTKPLEAGLNPVARACSTSLPSLPLAAPPSQARLSKARPGLFRLRLLNKLWYIICGTPEFALHSFRDLGERVFLECDGQPVPIPKGIEGIMVLNTPSYGGGSDLWDEQRKAPLAARRRLLSSAPQPISMSDGLLEVVGVTDVIHLALSLGGLSNGVRLCQGKTLRLYAPSKGVPLQVDGEPFNQPSDKPFTGLDCEPFDFSLERSDSALMLAAPLGAGGAEGAAEVAIERGVATGAVSVEQRESLLREIAT